MFYTYVYLNPFKPGKYTYGNFITFFYEPFYIGKGKDNRLYEHLNEKEYNTLNKHKFNTIKKIKNNNEYPMILKILDNIEEKLSLQYEEFLIKLIGRNSSNLGPLTNLTDGGEGVGSYWRGRKLSEERIKQIKVLTSGENNGMFGKKHSQDSKDKIRIKAKGRKGTKHTEDHKKYISERMTLEKHPNWKGGKTGNNKTGFMILYKSHPNSDRDGYIWEHRLVMEKHIGRYLTKNEIVYHITERCESECVSKFNKKGIITQKTIDCIRNVYKIAVIIMPPNKRR